MSTSTSVEEFGRESAGGPSSAVDLAITGMTCASCANRIERKLNKLPGVKATVNFATANARVTFPEALVPADLVETVESAGYGARLSLEEKADGPTGGGGDDTEQQHLRALRGRLVVSLRLRRFQPSHTGT